MENILADKGYSVLLTFRSMEKFNYDEDYYDDEPGPLETAWSNNYADKMCGFEDENSLIIDDEFFMYWFDFRHVLPTLEDAEKRIDYLKDKYAAGKLLWKPEDWELMAVDICPRNMRWVKDVHSS